MVMLTEAEYQRAVDEANLRDGVDKAHGNFQQSVNEDSLYNNIVGSAGQEAVRKWLIQCGIKDHKHNDVINHDGRGDSGWDVIVHGRKCNVKTSMMEWPLDQMRPGYCFNLSVDCAHRHIIDGFIHVQGMESNPLIYYVVGYISLADVLKQHVSNTRGYPMYLINFKKITPPGVFLLGGVH
jgi:hypothetical protein